MTDADPLSEIRRLAKERDNASDELARSHADTQVQQAIRAAVGVGVDEAEARKAAGDDVDKPGGLEAMTVAEMKAMATDLDVHVPSSAKKADLVDLLGEATTPVEAEPPTGGDAS